MAVLFEQIMPEGVDVAFLDAVTAEMGVESDPPKGLLVHVHSTDNGRARVVDVWDSAEDIEAFRVDRLMPALQKLAEERGVDMSTEPETSMREVAGLVRGR